MFNNDFIMPGKSHIFNRFMPGGPGPEQPDEVEVSQYSKERAARLGPMLSSMLVGGEGLNNAMGFAGNFGEQKQRDALSKGIEGGRFDLKSMLNRTVRRDDATVRGYAERSYDQAARGAEQGLEQKFELQKTAEREWAQAQATDMAAAGKRISAGVSDIYARGAESNTSLLASGGTFTENVMSGIGAGAGWMLAEQDFKQRMTTT
jgi:hypothetical protein